MPLPNHEPLPSDPYTAFKFAQAGFINTSPMSDYEDKLADTGPEWRGYALSFETDKRYDYQPPAAEPEIGNSGISSPADWKEASSRLRNRPQTVAGLGHASTSFLPEAEPDPSAATQPTQGGDVKNHRAQKPFLSELRHRGTGRHRG